MKGTALSFAKTPRGRRIAWLAVATLIMVLLAGFEVVQEARQSQSHFKPRPVYSKLDVKLVDAARIAIVSRMGKVELARAGKDPKAQVWVMPDAHDYPANRDRIHRLLLGLADLQEVEEKTALPERHAALDLVDPAAGGGAIEVTVQDGKGTDIADLLVGKLRPASATGQAGVYVRKKGDNQSYLAIGDIPVDVERKDWLEPGVIDLARDRISKVSAAPAGSPSYVLAHSKPEEANFTIQDLPKGRSMLSDTAANGVGAAAVDLKLDDVRPQSEISFAGASAITYETFDGLAVKLDIIDQNKQSWVRVTARSSDPKSAAEAQRINAKTAAWAYAVPSWKADLFRKPLESMLKTPEKAGGKKPPAP